MTTKYRVTTGIYEGHEFRGYNLDGRIMDCDSTGRSYPEENCEIVNKVNLGIKGFEVFAIYKNPSDYPDKYVLRRWVNDVPDKEPMAVENNIQDARLKVPKGKTLIPRTNNDDIVILETWL